MCSPTCTLSTCRLVVHRRQHVPLAHTIILFFPAGQEEPVRFLSGPSDPVEVCEDFHWKVLGGGPLLLYKNNTQVDVSLYNWQFDSLQGIYNVSWLSPVLVNSSIRLCYALISSYCSEAVDVIGKFLVYTCTCTLYV